MGSFDRGSGDRVSASVSVRDYSPVCGVAIHVDHARTGMTRSLQGSLQKALGGSRDPAHRKTIGWNCVSRLLTGKDRFVSAIRERGSRPVYEKTDLS